MQTHASKNQENTKRSTAAVIGNKQKQNSTTFRFADNRPETAQTQKFQKIARQNNSLQFVDNKSEVAQMKRLLELATNSPQNQRLTQLQKMANDYAASQELPFQKKASNTGLPIMAQGSIQVVSNQSSPEVTLSKSRLLRTSLTNNISVIQGDFYKIDQHGAYQQISGAPPRNMQPWIDATTGLRASHAGLHVYFEFDKAGLERQKHKGSRIGGRTSGLTLGNQADFGAGAWPGSRNWPGHMTGAASARNQRDAIPGIPHSNPTSWGHQVAKQWGGPADLNNAISATNDATPGGNAQEEYQTIVEDAVTYVVDHNPGISLSNFRIKHTAYKYPKTNVAKYVRFKIYRHDNTVPGWVLIVDQVTPDFADFLSGGRGNPVSARGAFQVRIENQLSALVPVHGQKKGTDNTMVRSWNSVVDHSPFANVRHPANNETIQSDKYSINIEANAVTNNVEVLIQKIGTQGIWNQARQTHDGTWWYDWNNIENGQYDIKPRGWKADGQVTEGKQVRMTKN